MDRDDAFDALARGMGQRVDRRRLVAFGLAGLGAGAFWAAAPRPSSARRRDRRHCPSERACGKRCCGVGKTCGNPVQGICVGPDNPVSMQ